MTKRRRERDRPKAGPEAAYDPNKRVLLSYSSDEDAGPAESARATTPEPTMPERDLMNYQIEEYEDSSAEEEPAGEEKLAKGPNNPRLRRRKVQINPDIGQRPVLGSLAYQYDDEDEQDWKDKDKYDDEFDVDSDDGALEYLSAVRKERLSLPSYTKTLQIGDAQKPTASTSSERKGDGASNDPAFGQSLTRTDQDIDDVDGDPSTAHLQASKSYLNDPTHPQYAYTRSLINRFLLKRQQLHKQPNSGDVAALDADHPIWFPENNAKAYKDWLRIIGTKAPLPAQVQSFDPDTIYRALELLSTHFIREGKAISPLTSAWIMSLLARFEVVGMLDNDDIYPLRELGKKAILVQLHYISPELAAQVEALHGSVDALSTDNPNEISSEEDAGADAAPSLNTMATLDMIVVIVGEVFGQKDLLEQRRVWGAETSS